MMNKFSGPADRGLELVSSCVRNGAVLITSRNKQAARDICGNATIFDVEKMGSSDAILLLRKKLPRDKADNAQEDEFVKLV
jgi:hypothetical protein